MARFSNPFVQYFNGSGQVLPGNKLFFYEVGTTTPKDTYSDSGLSTPNANPVIADANGRIPDIFLDGIYNVILKDANDITIDTADPVGDTGGDQWGVWLNDNIYSIPDIVKGSDGEYYRSIANANQGNDPISSPAQWEELELGRVWNPNITYSATDSVYGSDGNLYRSKAASNLNNDPISTNKWEVASKIAINGSPWMIDGMQISNGTDLSHDIDMAVGVCTDNAKTTVINSTSVITKQIDANWTEGSGVGGFPSGLTLSADTTYHFFAIAKNDGTVDAGFDSSLTASNLLSDATDYTKFRRVGSVITDSSSDIIRFVQVENTFMLYDLVRDANDINPGTSAQLTNTTTPGGVNVTGIYNIRFEDDSGGGANRLLVTSPLQNDATPDDTRMTILIDSSSGGNNVEGVQVEVVTDTSSQIRYRLQTSTATVVVRIYTTGWIDDRKS